MKYTGQHVRVRNLAKYQHYKDRTPPWIKLHQELLEDYDFCRLPDASKAHALCLMLLASRLENRIPADPAWIARKIGARSPVDLELLVAAAFIELVPSASDPAQPDSATASAALAERKQVARIEGEKRREEGEREAEAEREQRIPSPQQQPQPSGPAVAAAEAAEDRYCELVGEEFSRLRGVASLVTHADYQRILTWRREGIPVEIVRREMAALVQKRMDRGEKGRVNSLGYFDEAIRLAWSAAEACMAPGRRTEAAPLEVEPRLNRLAVALPADLAGRRVFVDRILGLDGESEAVEAALAVLDSELLDQASATLNGAGAAQLEADLAATLASLATRLPEDDLAAARERLRRQLLRWRLGLPVLSLFSPEAQGDPNA